MACRNTSPSSQSTPASSRLTSKQNSRSRRSTSPATTSTRAGKARYLNRVSPLPHYSPLHDTVQYVPPKPAPPPIKNAITDTTPKTKTTTTTTYEVLNPTASSSSSAAVPPPSVADAPDDEDEQQEDLPELTPSLAHFSRLPLWKYEQSFDFIQNHPDVIVAGASDALLVAAFQAQTDEHKKYAKQCVHQSLLLQYCDKLSDSGRDGVGLFFKKWVVASSA